MATRSLTRTLPSIAAGSGGLSRYLEEIRRFPMLEPNEEYMLAKRWQEHEDSEAAHKLVTSHLRLVARIAMGYRGYGLPIGEVISEGNVGLMQAVKRFEPDKGFRLATSLRYMHRNRGRRGNLPVGYWSPVPCEMCASNQRACHRERWCSDSVCPVSIRKV